VWDDKTCHDACATSYIQHPLTRLWASQFHKVCCSGSELGWDKVTLVQLIRISVKIPLLGMTHGVLLGRPTLVIFRDRL